MLRGIGLPPMRRLGRELVYEDVHGRGQARTIWMDDNGIMRVMWYGGVRRVELVRLLNCPRNGDVTERYVIQWDGHMV